MTRNRTHCLLFTTAIVLLAAPTPSQAGKKVPEKLDLAVDCAAGESLSDALAKPAHRLSVEFEGSCIEDPLIDQDRVSLRGIGAGAEIVGTLSVRGASEVVLADFTARDGASRNIRIRDGAAATLTNITSQNSTIGIQVMTGSTATLTDCSFSGGGFAGLGVTDNATVSLFGTVTASFNGNAGIFLTGEAALSSRATLEASDNSFAGIFIQNGATAELITGITAERNGSHGVGLINHASLSGRPVIANDNGFGGIVLTDNCSIDSGGEFHSNGFAGVYAERSSTVTLSEFVGATNVSGNGVYGVYLDGGRATIANTTVLDSFFADFGAQVEFKGGNSITGLSCDGTVISRNAPAPCP